MRILLSAYTCGAGHGSEPGVGWNVARGLALRGHEVTVVTSPLYAEETQRAIEAEKLPIRLIHVDNSTPSNLFIKRHVRWQKKAAVVIRREAQRVPYNVVHHVTFNQYRGLRDVFLAELPYLVGPIGGAETIAPVLLWHGGLRAMVILKEIVRYLALDAVPAVWRCNNCSHPGQVLASNDITAQRLNRGLVHLHRAATVLPAIAIAESEICAEAPRRCMESPYFLFYGSLKRPEKGIAPVLEAFARYRSQGGQLNLVMVGTAEGEKERIFREAERFGISRDCLTLVGFVPRARMLELMQGATAMLYAAYRDSGGMSVLEAVAQGINVICFDIPSQRWLPENFAIKVPVPSLWEGKSAVAEALAQGMHKAEVAPDHPQAWHEERAAWLRETMTWDSRITRIEQEYSQLSVSL